MADMATTPITTATDWQQEKLLQLSSYRIFPVYVCCGLRCCFQLLLRLAGDCGREWCKSLARLDNDNIDNEGSDVASNIPALFIKAQFNSIKLIKVSQWLNALKAR